MVDTYRLMTQVRLPEYKNESLEHLAAEYKVTNNQSILAEVFCREFKLWCSLVYSSRFSNVNRADLVSDCLSSIHRCLISFNPEYKAKVTTYITKDMYCAFITLAYKAARDKNRLNYSLEYLTEKNDNNSYELNFIKPKNVEMSEIELLEAIRVSGLSEKERIMCKAILDDPYISNTELADVIKVHRHTIRAMKQTLQRKLSWIVS